MDKEFLEAFSKINKIIDIIILEYIPEQFQSWIKPFKAQIIGHLWLNPEKTKKLYRDIKLIMEEK